jgi:hypothetical protein
MKTIVRFLALSGTTIFALGLVICAVTQPGFDQTKVTWYGELRGVRFKVEGMRLDQISAAANMLAAVYGGSIRFVTEDRGISYQAYSEGYDESKCADVREEIRQGGMVITDRVRVCLVPAFELPAVEG